MDCDNARQWLAFARPGELEAGDLADLDEHLAACPDCAPFARAERQADDAVARAMRIVPIPDGMRARLTTRLATARTAWWKQLVLQTAAVSVGTLLTATLIYTATRPTLDLMATAEAANIQSGLWKPHQRGFDDANDLLRALGSPPVAPGDFDYRFLKMVSRMDSHGVRSAPTLLFTRGDAYAKVVLVRESEIKNLRQLADQVGEDSGCWVTVLSVPDRGGWFYIITTYGKPIQFFLNPTASVVVG